MAAAEQVAGRGAEVKFIQADADRARRARGAASAHLDGIDLLVNSTAGLRKPELLHDIPLATIPDIVMQQLVVVRMMCRIALLRMRAHKCGLIA